MNIPSPSFPNGASRNINYHNTLEANDKYMFNTESTIAGNISSVETYNDETARKNLTSVANSSAEELSY